MPIKDAAKKALRQAKKRAIQNKIVRTAYKDALKAVHKAIEAGEVSADLMKMAQQKLDKAAKRGVLKKQTASRRLSRLVKQVANVAKKK